MKELSGDLTRPPDDVGSLLRLRARMRRHDLHAKAAGANRNRGVFDQIREYATVETQGCRDPAHLLSSQQCRHKRSRLAEADDSRRGERVAQNVSQVADPFSQQVAFDAANDLNRLQDCSALVG